MRDYKNHDYNRGFKTAPELAVIGAILGYLLVELSWVEVSRFFGF